MFCTTAEREEDLKLLGAPDGGGVGKASKMLVPTKLDADDEDADDGESDESSDDDDEVAESAATVRVCARRHSEAVQCLLTLPLLLLKDDEAELLAELERIKKERAEEAARKAAEEAAQSTAEKTEEALRGNPILQQKLGITPSFEIKRRWDDDVVFKNQVRRHPLCPWKGRHGCMAIVQFADSYVLLIDAVSEIVMGRRLAGSQRPKSDSSTTLSGMTFTAASSTDTSNSLLSLSCCSSCVECLG